MKGEFRRLNKVAIYLESGEFNLRVMRGGIYWNTQAIEGFQKWSLHEGGNLDIRLGAVCNTERKV